MVGVQCRTLLFVFRSIPETQEVIDLSTNVEEHKVDENEFDQNNGDQNELGQKESVEPTKTSAFESPYRKSPSILRPNVGVVVKSTAVSDASDGPNVGVVRSTDASDGPNVGVVKSTTVSDVSDGKSGEETDPQSKTR